MQSQDIHSFHSQQAFEHYITKISFKENNHFLRKTISNKNCNSFGMKGLKCQYKEVLNGLDDVYNYCAYIRKWNRSLFQAAMEKKGKNILNFQRIMKGL